MPDRTPSGKGDSGLDSEQAPGNRAPEGKSRSGTINWERKKRWGIKLLENTKQHPTEALELTEET
jgi:hypothetical protein